MQAIRSAYRPSKSTIARMPAPTSNKLRTRLQIRVKFDVDIQKTEEEDCIEVRRG